MISLSRKLLILFYLSACSTINTGYFDIFYENFKSDNLGSTAELKASIPYSFIRVNYGKREAIFVLQRIDENGIEYWVGASQEVIVTFKGLILSTKGLDSDYSIYEKDWLLSSANHLKQSYINNIYLRNPDLKFAESSNQLLHKGSTKNCSIYVSYEKVIRGIGFREKDFYCFGSDSNIMLTEQYLFPLTRSPIKIEFHYQY